MLTEYIRVAMDKATYETLEDGSSYGEIPGLQGVYANELTLDGCRSELQSALEDWIVFGLANGFALPVLNGINLNAERVA
ncbi:MAG: type II toxin-antitoxin system HicB family antitoxin [Chloroflexi bacterium]|nr:type II toxin-antitoxin system HicB family antitoxin [Chloroflexota bacterium]